MIRLPYARQRNRSNFARPRFLLSLASDDKSSVAIGVAIIGAIVAIGIAAHTDQVSKERSQAEYARSHIADDRQGALQSVFDLRKWINICRLTDWATASQRIIRDNGFYESTNNLLTHLQLLHMRRAISETQFKQAFSEIEDLHKAWNETTDLISKLAPDFRPGEPAADREERARSFRPKWDDLLRKYETLSSDITATFKE